MEAGPWRVGDTGLAPAAVLEPAGVGGEAAPGPTSHPERCQMCLRRDQKGRAGGTVGRKQEGCQDKEFITEESCRDLTLETSEIFCVI